MSTLVAFLSEKRLIWPWFLRPSATPKSPKQHNNVESCFISFHTTLGTLLLQLSTSLLGDKQKNCPIWGEPDLDPILHRNNCRQTQFYTFQQASCADYRTSVRWAGWSCFLKNRNHNRPRSRITLTTAAASQSGEKSVTATFKTPHWRRRKRPPKYIATTQRPVPKNRRRPQWSTRSVTHLQAISIDGNSTKMLKGNIKKQ